MKNSLVFPHLITQGYFNFIDTGVTNILLGFIVESEQMSIKLQVNKP